MSRPSLMSGSIAAQCSVQGRVLLQIFFGFFLNTNVYQFKDFMLNDCKIQYQSTQQETQKTQQGL